MNMRKLVVETPRVVPLLHMVVTEIEIKTPLKRINIIEANNEGTTMRRGNSDERGEKELRLKDQKAMAL